MTPYMVTAHQLDPRKLQTKRYVQKRRANEYYSLETDTFNADPEGEFHSAQSCIAIPNEVVAYNRGHLQADPGPTGERF